MLEPFKHRFIPAAQPNFRVDPGAVKSSEDRSGQFFISFSYPIQLRFELCGETTALLGLLVKKRFQVSPLHLRGCFLIALLTVLAGLNKFFKNTDSVIHVHDFPPEFWMPPAGEGLAEFRPIKSAGKRGYGRGVGAGIGGIMRDRSLQCPTI